jgi:hypothetical protein
MTKGKINFFRHEIPYFLSVQCHCRMNQNKNPNHLENQFSFSLTESISISVSEENLFRFGEENGIRATMEQPVNNYLKSPEEIEAEFCFVINSRKAAYQEADDSLDTYGRLKMKTDGYMNIHNLDETLSGFMEENY